MATSDDYVKAQMSRRKKPAEALSDVAAGRAAAAPILPDTEWVSATDLYENPDYDEPEGF